MPRTRLDVVATAPGTGRRSPRRCAVSCRQLRHRSGSASDLDV